MNSYVQELWKKGRGEKKAEGGCSWGQGPSNLHFLQNQRHLAIKKQIDFPLHK